MPCSPAAKGSRPPPLPPKSQRLPVESVQVADRKRGWGMLAGSGVPWVPETPGAAAPVSVPPIHVHWLPWASADGVAKQSRARQNRAKRVPAWIGPERNRLACDGGCMSNPMYRSIRMRGPIHFGQGTGNHRWKSHSAKADLPNTVHLSIPSAPHHITDSRNDYPWRIHHPQPSKRDLEGKPENERRRRSHTHHNLLIP